MEFRERQFSLTKAGKVSSIEPKAFRVLLFLLHNPQKLITKDESCSMPSGAIRLSPKVLSHARSGCWRSVLGDDIRQPALHRRPYQQGGYRFVAAVEEQVEFSERRNCTRRPARRANRPGTAVRGQRRKTLVEPVDLDDHNGAHAYTHRRHCCIGVSNRAPVPGSTP